MGEAKRKAQQREESPEEYKLRMEELYLKRQASSVLLLEMLDTNIEWTDGSESNWDFEAMKSVKKFYNFWTLAHKIGPYKWKLHITHPYKPDKDPYFLIFFIPARSITIDQTRRLIAAADRENYRLAVGQVRGGTTRIIQDNHLITREDRSGDGNHRHLIKGPPRSPKGAKHGI